MCFPHDAWHAFTAHGGQLVFYITQAVIARWNDQATLEARGRYSGEISRLQKAHAHQCEGRQAQHNAVCGQIRKHNEAIWPQVTIAQAAQGELDRVRRFTEHIRCTHMLGMLHSW